MEHSRSRFGVSDKIALVTGAASGIGLATVSELLEKGWGVIRVDKKFDQESPDSGTFDVACDLSRRENITELFLKIKREIGHLDFLVSCAGFHCAKSVTEASDEDFDRAIAINLTAPFYCMKYALPMMGPGSSIVNIGSDVYFLPDRDAPLYTAAKAGMVALTRAAALEWGSKGIRINVVCPGATDTPFLRNAFDNNTSAIVACAALNPLRRMATPEEIAHVVVFLGLDASFANGAVWAIDGGYTVQGGSEPPKS